MTINGTQAGRSGIVNIDDFREVAKNLEPDAWAGGDGNEPFVISMAVSLKRIADALESQASIAATSAAYAPATHDLRGLDA